MLVLEKDVAHSQKEGCASQPERKMDAYFSVDVETDGPIPGPYSMLSFAVVYAGSFDGVAFRRPDSYVDSFYRELKPISESFEPQALSVNGLDREKLMVHGSSPEDALNQAADWISKKAGAGQPVLVAYPLSFDWTWLYWYFVRYAKHGSPFDHSRCFDIKTALAVKAGIPVSEAGRWRLDRHLRSAHPHTHHAVDDAISQAQIFANLFEWGGCDAPVGAEDPIHK